MKYIASRIRRIDLFGVTYSPAISDGLEYKHSSIYGGIISFIICSISLLYACYYLYLWWNLLLLPKVTSDQHTFKDGFDFEMINSHIQMYAIYGEGQSYIDPFKKDEIVLLPLIVDLDVSEFVSLIYNVTDEKIIDLNIPMGKTKQYVVLFTLCKPEYLSDDCQCASKEVQEQYFAQIGNQIYADFMLTTYNPSTFQPETYKRTYQFFIHDQAEICSLITLHYIMNNYYINQAFLFSTESEQKNFISDSLNFSQVGTKAYCDKYFLEDTYGAYWILFSHQYYTIHIGYPSISEVLAAIGSIISVLFSVKFIITKLNLFQMRQSILDEIMQQYYPEIKQFKIVKNFFGKIITVKFKGLNVDILSYINFQKKIHKQMGCKLNYNNLLYEMSRLQFIVLSLQRRSQIEKVHNIGIKVPLQLSENAETYTIQHKTKFSNLNSERSDYFDPKFDILSMDDALLLSPEYKRLGKVLTYRCLEKQQNIHDQDNINEESEPDFYDVNYIKKYAN